MGLMRPDRAASSVRSSRPMVCRHGRPRGDRRARERSSLADRPAQAARDQEQHRAAVQPVVLQARARQRHRARWPLAVAEYVRRYLYKPPSDGYRKLEDADSLDLACEALVADPEKPYAHLFSERDRAAARARLARHVAAIEARKAASQARIDARASDLPDNVEELRALAAQPTQLEDAVAINRAILRLDAYDIVALNRLGRAYDALGARDQAEQTFR